MRKLRVKCESGYVGEADVEDRFPLGWAKRLWMHKGFRELPDGRLDKCVEVELTESEAE